MIRKLQFILKTVHPETKKEYLPINQFLRLQRKKFTNIKRVLRNFIYGQKN